MPEDAPVNIDATLITPFSAGQRVLGIQTKLHSWAAADQGRRFDDLFNLVADPSFLVTAWNRVRDNTGARTAGIDKRTAHEIEASEGGVQRFLEDLRAQLKDRTFRPLPVRQRMIPKTSGKLRALGIPTVADRVVQASLKQVLEPILETDFSNSSYGFRPGRRAQDAIADIRHFAYNGYEWVFEADIASCFDEISHTALLGRLRRRIGDKRVLALVTAFLKAGVLDQEGLTRPTSSGTPQGGILSPLLANLALSHLDEHFQAKWDALGSARGRYRHRERGGATFRLVRYADDFVIMTNGTRDHTEALWGEVADVLSGIGLRLAHPGRRNERGVRLPWHPHPAAPPTRKQPVIRLYLSVEHGESHRPAEDQRRDQQTQRQPAREPDVPELRTHHSWVDQLSPAWGFFSRVQQSPELSVAEGLDLVTGEASQTRPEVDRRSLLPTWVVA